jgi:hypothetical protein
MNPRYPLYIPSKGRWHDERRLTVRVLEEMRVPYRIVVEEQEAENYRAVVDPAFGTVIVLDPQYQRDYDTCDDLGDTMPKGSGPARNFIWDHAVSEGHRWHWVVDDNIRVFYRLNRNRKVRLLGGTPFYVLEDFANRYANLAMCGPNYQYFAKQRQPLAPLILNTRIYSCILIRGDIPYRWRCRFNEDTDLSLRALKDGWCTAQCNAILQDKQTTQSVRGGNTDTIYVDGTLNKSRMIARLHPDVARVVWKFGRWHHHVDYRPFKRNRLIRRPDAVIPEGVNEYGMRLVKVGEVA